MVVMARDTRRRALGRPWDDLGVCITAREGRSGGHVHHVRSRSRAALLRAAAPRLDARPRRGPRRLRAVGRAPTGPTGPPPMPPTGRRRSARRPPRRCSPHPDRAIPSGRSSRPVTVGPEPVAIRVELCGALTVEVDGRRVEDDLPGRQGRLLFAYLARNHERPVRRDELVDVVWDDHPPGSPDAGLAALLTRVRQALGPDAVVGPRAPAARRRGVGRPRRGARRRGRGRGGAGGGRRRGARPSGRARRWSASSGRCCPSSPGAGSTSSAPSSTGCTPTRWRRWRGRRCGSAAASCRPPSARRAR